MPAADVFEDGGYFYVELELLASRSKTWSLSARAISSGTGGKKAADGADHEMSSAWSDISGLSGVEFSFPEALDSERVEARIQDGVPPKNPKPENRTIRAVKPTRGRDHGAA